MLAVRVVDEHHREAEFLGLVQLNEAENSSCRLLTSANHPRNEVSVLGVHKVNEVTAIINDDVRSHFKHPADMLFILLRSRIIPRINIEAGFYKSCSHIILSRERIASCHIHLSSTCCENLTEICCLGLKMH